MARFKLDNEARHRLGAELRRLRTALTYSLRDVEAATGISNGHLAQIELGATEPSLSVLRSIASFYGTSLGDLVAAIDSAPDPVDTAFQTVLGDPTFRLATRLRGEKLSQEAKRAIVELYEGATNKKLLP